MDKYEYRVKTEQMLEYVETKQYKKAMEIADTIDWRRVKNASMLSTVSEIYEYNGEFLKSRDVLFMAYDRSPGSRKIVYRLGILALKIGDTEEASDCYEEFVKLAPRDPNQYILKYKILNSQNAPVMEQIGALEEFKRAEYVEKWAYELASLYEKAGMLPECLEECDDLILWFSEGKYVYQAMELKMKYKPLTPLQQEKYDSRPGATPKPQRDVEPEILTSVQPEPVEEVAAEPVVEESVVEEPAAEPVAEPAAVEEIILPEEPEEEVAEEPIAEAVLDEVMKEIDHAEEPEEEEAAEAVPVEEVVEEALAEEPVKGSAITKIVSGATLKEALTAAANGIKAEEKAMAAKDEQLRISGLMKIDDILMEWEEKQKVNAEAIEKQKVEDEERIRKEREAAKARQEEERKELERKAAEAAKKRAEEEAARKAAEEEAAKRAAIEAAIKKAKEENKKVLSEKTQRLPDDILQLVEQLENRVAEPKKVRAEKIYDDDLAELAEAMGEYEEDNDEEEASLEENLEGTFEDEFELEEVPEEEDFEEEDFEEEDFEESDEEYDEDDDFEIDDDFDEDEFEIEDEFDEDESDEDEFDEDEFEIEDEFDEDEFDEDEFDEDEFDEDEFDEDEFEVSDEMNFDPSEFFGEDAPAEVEEEEITTYDEPLEIEEPSEEEIQKRIKKSKGGVPFDTGFVVTGRYDLSATSEIGLKAGLTEEQKKLFSYFVPVRGMSEQIVEVLDNDRRAQREGTSKTGNILVVGRKGSGKTVLSVDIVKAIQKQRNLKQGKLAIVTGESLNKKDLANIVQKLRGGAIIIEKAGKLNTRTINELNYLMEKKTGEMLFVLEDQRKPLERILTANPDFKRKFTSKLELPVFINDELVTFGQTYAKENGYKLDEMGILALYSRIDVLQREDHAVSVAEVKEIMDEAIAHSQKANVKHLARRVFKRSTDESDRIILKEEDFRV